MSRYVLWVIPDRGGGWTPRAYANTPEEAEQKRGQLYQQLGDVTVRVLPQDEHPANGCLDITHPHRTGVST